MKSKHSKTRFCIICASILLIALLIFFGWYKSAGFDLPLWKAAAYGFGIVAVVVGLGLTIWLVVSVLQKEDDKDIELPRKYVDTGKIPDIWKEALIINTGIPYIVQHWNEDKIVPVRADTVRIIDSRSYSDSSKQTSERFFAFEALVKEGEKRGLNFIITREDHGEDWIRDNWNWRFNQHKSFETFDPQEDRFPLTSSKDERTRLTVRRMELVELGYTPSELQTTIDPLIEHSIATPAIQKETKAQPQIKSPGISEQYPELDDDDEDLDDLQKDKQKYRERADT